MNRFLAALVAILCALVAPQALAQNNPSPIQLRLTNSMSDKVDYYLQLPDQKQPSYAGSIPGGAILDVESRKGQVWIFGMKGTKIQQYTVRSELFQHLTLVPKGQQLKLKVASEYQNDNSQQAQGGGDTSDLRWQYNTYDAGDGVTNSTITFGIPETDAVQFTATCASNNDGYAELIFSYNIEGMRQGDPLAIQLEGSGYNHVMDAGILVVSESGEGQQGLGISLSPDEPVWQELARLKSINYGVEGGELVPMSLAGFSGVLNRFISDCENYAGRDSPQVADTNKPTKAPVVATNSKPSTQKLTCDDFGTMKAGDTGVESTVTFVNKSGEYRVALWMDFDGTPVQMEAIEENGSLKVETWSTHPWVFTDGPGNCIEVVVPKAGTSTVNLTVKSTGAGGD